MGTGMGTVHWEGDMGRRGTYGDGSIFKTNDGTWVARLELGVDLNGKRKRWQGKSRTQAGALEKLRKARAERDTTGIVTAKNLTVTQWLSHWLDAIVAPSVKPLTLKDYRQVCDNHLVPAIGAVRLDRLTPAHVRKLHADIVAARSLGTANKVHRVLRAALGDAERDGLIPRNVARLVETPAAKGGRSALTRLEATKIIRATDDPMHARWMLALLTGARQGECLGLTWDHVDLERGEIDIAWQLQRLPMAHGCKQTPAGPTCGKKRASSCPDAVLDVRTGFEYRQLDGAYCLTLPKSSAGTRVIPIADTLGDALRDHGLRQLADGTPNPHGLVWCKADGAPIDKTSDGAAWAVLLERLDIQPVPLHCARHTTATLLMEDGVDVTIIQGGLGHSQATTTRSYQHSDTTMLRRALQSLADSLA